MTQSQPPTAPSSAAAATQPQTPQEELAFLGKAIQASTHLLGTLTGVGGALIVLGGILSLSLQKDLDHLARGICLVQILIGLSLFLLAMLSFLRGHTLTSLIKTLFVTGFLSLFVLVIVPKSFSDNFGIWLYLLIGLPAQGFFFIAIAWRALIIEKLEFMQLEREKLAHGGRLPQTPLRTFPGNANEEIMVKAEKLTKYFGEIRAVDGIDFEVRRGDVMGLLGPNGAGKSTTMRLMTTFLPATSGRVQVAGFDVVTHSMQARERIGYLPEGTPLYGEMRALDYLHHQGMLRSLPRKERVRAIYSAIDRAGLWNYEHRVIGALSKGYRKRVGLAAALLHRPDLLILDEPTEGLDPNQVIELRNLIRELAGEHTIILSTHILSEVEAICKSVLIINRGKIGAAGSLSTLTAGRRLRLKIDGEKPEAIRQRLEERLAPQGTKIQGDHLLFEFGETTNFEQGARAASLAIQELAAAQQWKILELAHERPTLEEIFVRVTLRGEKELSGKEG